MASITSTRLTGNSQLDQEIISRGLDARWQLLIQLLTGQIAVTAAAQKAGVSRVTIYQWLSHFVMGALAGLTGQKPGPKVDWQARCRELEAENKALKQEIKRLKRLYTQAQAVINFLSAILRPLLGTLNTAYRRFSAADKWTILQYLESLRTQGGTIMGFSQAVQKAYSTLLRWRKLVRGKNKAEALAILADKTQAFAEPRLPAATRQAIVACHEQYPHWGAKQIAHYLGQKQGLKMSPATVHKVLKQEHPSAPWDKERRQKRHTFGRVNFATCIDHAEITLGGLKAQLCLLLDETSRFILGWSLDLSKSAAQVVDLIKTVSRQYGRPTLVKTDNAPEFRQEFRRLINVLGIFHLNSPYYYAPFNGKVERVLRDLRRYLKFQPCPANLEQLAAQVEAWVYEHNYLRCHEDLRWLTPAAVFLEKKTPTLPDYIEKIYVRQQEKRLVLKFKNRRNRPARLELTLPEAA
ncbi:MAG: DDE-type integrase/transposase/recombinase [Moorella humiferrea]|nr:DDE-type integrase/transposase/recombinase [Moorella humiferrea]